MAIDITGQRFGRLVAAEQPGNCRWATAKEQASNRRFHGAHPVEGRI